MQPPKAVETPSPSRLGVVTHPRVARDPLPVCMGRMSRSTIAMSNHQANKLEAK